MRAFGHYQICAFIIKKVIWEARSPAAQLQESIESDAMCLYCKVYRMKWTVPVGKHHRIGM